MYLIKNPFLSFNFAEDSVKVYKPVDPSGGTFCFLSFSTHEAAVLAKERLSQGSSEFTRLLIVGWADPVLEPDMSKVIF